LRRDNGPVGWYHRSGATFDPTCPHLPRYTVFERSSRAEVERWRLDWIVKHDPDNVFNDDCSMVSADGDGGAFPVELSYVHLGSVRHTVASVRHPIDARISAATRTFGALKTVLRSRDAHLHAKHRVYVGAVLPALLYGCESWLVDVTPLQRLVVFHNGCVRGICGSNRRQVREGRITAIELLRRLRLQPIEKYLRPEGAIVQAPRNAINSRTIVGLVVGTERTPGQTVCGRE